MITAKKVMVAVLFLVATVCWTKHAAAGQYGVGELAVRNATWASQDFVRTIENGIQVVLNVTAVPGVDTIQLVVEGKDAYGNYYPLLTSSTLATTGLTWYEVVPAGAVVAGVSVRHFIPPIYRLRIVHSGAGNFTYSLALNTGQTTK